MLLGHLQWALNSGKIKDLDNMDFKHQASKWDSDSDRIAQGTGTGTGTGSGSDAGTVTIYVLRDRRQADLSLAQAQWMRTPLPGITVLHWRPTGDIHAFRP